MDELIYEKSFVAFVDVLGFRDMVFGQNKTKINKYFKIVNETLSDLKQIELKKPIKSIVISDSIILSVPLLSDSVGDLDRLRQLCVAIAKLQHNLALNDIWVRGAITYGETYFDEVGRQVVGPAYVNAYLLEESSAIYPRVILDSKIIKEFYFSSSTEFIDKINMLDEGGLNYSDWCNNVLFSWTLPNGNPVNHIKQDVPLFIDYLSRAAQNNDSDLVQIICRLEDNLYQSVPLYSKFRWVSDYLISLSEREQLNDNLLGGEAVFRLSNL